MTPTTADMLNVPPREKFVLRPLPEGIVRPYRYDKSMGEVRTEVILTSAYEASRLAHGEGETGGVKRITLDAVVDTGAVQTVLPQEIADQLGLLVSHQSLATYADGHSEIVSVSEPILVEIMGRRTYDEALILGDEVLIGQTVLEKLDLWVDCKRQRLVPNPDHPDFPVAKLRTPR